MRSTLSVVVAVLGVAVLSASAQDLSRFRRWVWDGVYGSAQATRGRDLYNEHCAKCHGAGLNGPTVSGRDTVSQQVDDQNVRRNRNPPPLIGDAFIANWSDLSLGDLFERNRSSMPQDRPGSLSRQQNADILAFILQRNGFRPGLEELVPERTTLETIRFGR